MRRKSLLNSQDTLPNAGTDTGYRIQIQGLGDTDTATKIERYKIHKRYIFSSTHSHR